MSTASTARSGSGIGWCPHWSSATARWAVSAHRADTHDDTDDTDDTVTLTCSFLLVPARSCSFLFVCSGYYRYDEGFRPEFPGENTFAGRLVHPQHWPAALARGSGPHGQTGGRHRERRHRHHPGAIDGRPGSEGDNAAAVASYVAALPATDPIATRVQRWLPRQAASRAIRWKNVLLSTAINELSRHRPELLKSMLRRSVVTPLPAGFGIDTHFTPAYNPWDQRLCIAPDGDLFRAIGSGTADIVTDHIAEITCRRINLTSGRHLDADIIVSATGLNVLAIGGMALTSTASRSGCPTPSPTRA